MIQTERTILGALLALKSRTQPANQRFRFRKATNADFTRAVESRGEAAAPPRKTGTLAAFRDDLKPIVGDDAGGMFVEWTAGRTERPIVYLSSEGGVQVAAANARELFGVIAWCDRDGWGFPDAIRAASAQLVALDAEKAALQTDAVFTEPPGPIDAEVVQVLAAHDVPAVTDVLATVQAAARRYLWSFIDRLDEIVTGHKAHHVWFDAWNAPGAAAATVRAFSPKERYAVGERLTYAVAGLPPQRAIVLAHPKPDRVLLGDRSNVSLRAYT